MKNRFLAYLIMNILMALPAVLLTQKPDAANQKKQSNFTGNVAVKMHTEPKNSLDCSLGSVSFGPGARTNWHKHPGGQILLITEGTAFYQERGSEKRTLKMGESITCPANVEHWHGATPKVKMTHLAVGPNTNRGPVVWLEKVTDNIYLK